MLESRDEGVLDGLLGEVEVAGGANQACDYPAGLLAKYAVDGIERERAATPDAATFDLSQRP